MGKYEGLTANCKECSKVFPACRSNLEKFGCDKFCSVPCARRFTGRSKRRPNISCASCQKEFYPKTNKIVYCSRVCYITKRKQDGGFSKSRAGWSEEAKIEHSKRIKAYFDNGGVSWNKGKKLPQFSGENAAHWSGDKVEYMGLHAWIRKQLGNPLLCSHCKSTIQKRYEWANISGEYNRELSDWIRLCRSCHIIFDRKNGTWGNATKLIRAQKLDRKVG